MNKILNNKINSNLTQIISSYTLPPLLLYYSRIEKLLNEILILTINIKSSLTSGKCYDNNEDNTYLHNHPYNLKNNNCKIKHKYADKNSDWWTIRKC